MDRAAPLSKRGRERLILRFAIWRSGAEAFATVWRGMTVSYQSGGAEHVAPAAALFIETVQDLARRNGLPASAPSPEQVEPWYHYVREQGLFEVALEGERLVAFASGIVRDDLFFLSMFWTHPSRQQRGVGKPLLDRMWAEATARGARTFSVWSSVDFAALGLYLRRGMRPAGPILSFGGTPRPTETLGDFELAPMEAAVAGNLDQAVRGTARPLDHAFFAKQKQSAHLVCRGASTLGYFYAHEGRVGPAAWVDEREGRLVLRAAMAAAAEHDGEVTLSVWGMNRVAVDVAMEAGLHITGSSQLLCSEPFGAMERYVPSGPALF